MWNFCLSLVLVRAFTQALSMWSWWLRLCDAPSCCCQHLLQLLFPSARANQYVQVDIKRMWQHVNAAKDSRFTLNYCLTLHTSASWQHRGAIQSVQFQGRHPRCVSPLHYLTKCELWLHPPPRLFFSYMLNDCQKLVFFFAENHNVTGKLTFYLPSFCMKFHHREWIVVL